MAFCVAYDMPAFEDEDALTCPSIFVYSFCFIFLLVLLTLKMEQDTISYAPLTCFYNSHLINNSLLLLPISFCFPRPSLLLLLVCITLLWSRQKKLVVKNLKQRRKSILEIPCRIKQMNLTIWQYKSSKICSHCDVRMKTIKC